MESKKIEVFYYSTAKNAITKIGKYIEEIGYPETADKFCGRLYAFGDSLAVFPDKYPLCRFPILAKQQKRCALFEQNYIFIYKTIGARLIIYNVVNCKAIV